MRSKTVIFIEFINKHRIRLYVQPLRPLKFHYSIVSAVFRLKTVVSDKSRLALSDLYAPIVVKIS